MHPVIPIHDAHACAGRRPLAVRPPRLQGCPERLDRLIQAVSAAVYAPQGPIDPDQPVGAWLRSLRLDADEAELHLAAELGCRGEMASQLAFDVLRKLLRDTDIYVSIEPESAASLHPPAA